MFHRGDPTAFPALMQATGRMTTDSQASDAAPGRLAETHRPERRRQTSLTDLVVRTFRLNARLMEVAQELAGAGGLHRRLVAGTWRGRRRAANVAESDAAWG